MNYIDPDVYAVTGAEYLQTDSEGMTHIIVKSAELAGTNWNTYVGGTGVWRISSREHRTLKAARAAVKKMEGWKEV